MHQKSEIVTKIDMKTKNILKATFNGFSIKDKEMLISNKISESSVIFRLWSSLTSDEKMYMKQYFEKVIAIENQPKEPILIGNHNLALLDIKYPDLYEMLIKHYSNFWIKQELDLKDDFKQYEKLSKEKKHFVKMILGFFAQADGLVNKNLETNFAEEVKIPEAQMFYHFQIAAEDIHRDMYSEMIKTYIKNDEERDYLFNAIDNISVIKNKADWMNMWMHRELNSFHERLIAFAIVEGVFFSSAFCAVFWFKKQNILPGFTTSNEFIARDEGLHRDFACLLYSKLENKLSTERIHEMMKGAYKCESDFVDECLNVELIGMKAAQMKQYVQYCIDHLLINLGVPELYKVENPFPWMKLQSMYGKGNFFEKRNTQYNKSIVGENNSMFDFGF